MKAFYKPSLGLLIIRLVLGIIFIAHGAQKLFGAFGGGGIEGTAGFFGSLGIPAPELMAWVVGILEFFGGILLIIGLLTPLVAAALAFNMLVAILTAKLDSGFFVSQGGWEFELMLMAAALGLVFTGAGAYALDARNEGRVAASA